MLLWIFEYLIRFHHGFQVFHYITLRSVLATLTALVMSLVLGPWMIKHLTVRQIGQSIRKDGPQSHLKKSGTPTMGGALILTAVILSSLLWSDLHNRYVWVVLSAIIGFGTIGWVDDYRKLIKRDSRGLSGKWRLFWEVIIAALIGAYLYRYATAPVQTHLIVPFFKHLLVPLGWFFVPFVCLVIVGSGNAVNLTDGLDGLAIMPTVLIAGALGVFAYTTGNISFSTYLAIPYVPGAGEIAIICGTLVGAGLGFLWFNAYPAQVFMGDVGALGLGAALGSIAVVVRQELILVVMGGVFVLETVSVILQVASFKLTGRRIFRMAPIHHHFELKGWAEPKIIVRFWIITVVLVLFSLATLKLR